MLLLREGGSSPDTNDACLPMILVSLRYQKAGGGQWEFQGDPGLLALWWAAKGPAS